MKTFGSIAGFVAHLNTLAAAEKAALQRGLRQCAEAVENTAKAEFGGSQEGGGPFPAWQALAPATVAGRAAQGGDAGAPLVGSGALRDSISHDVQGLSATIGSNSEVMAYQELGTANMPPRPVLGPALLRNKELIEETLGRAAAAGLLHGSGVGIE